MGTHEFSPLRREQVAISGNREWLRREWKQHDDQSFIFGGRSGDGASFLGALLSVDNNVEAAETQPMLGLELGAFLPPFVRHGPRKRLGKDFPAGSPPGIESSSAADLQRQAFAVVCFG